MQAIDSSRKAARSRAEAVTCDVERYLSAHRHNTGWGFFMILIRGASAWRRGITLAVAVCLAMIGAVYSAPTGSPRRHRAWSRRTSDGGCRRAAHLANQRSRLEPGDAGNVVFATGSFMHGSASGRCCGGAGEVAASTSSPTTSGTGNRVTKFNQWNQRPGPGDVGVLRTARGSTWWGLHDRGRCGARSPRGVRYRIPAPWWLTSLSTSAGRCVRSRRATLSLRGWCLRRRSRPIPRRAWRPSRHVHRRLAAWAPNGGRQQGLGHGPEPRRQPSHRRRAAFTTINGAAAYGMGAVDPITGASLPWAATDRSGTPPTALRSPACGPTANRSTAPGTPSVERHLRG